MQHEAADKITVTSAGTQPGPTLNLLSAEVLQDLGIDISIEYPKPLTAESVQKASLVVVLGTEARVPEVAGVTIEICETDEPSERGIDSRERMELVRDDIHMRVRALQRRLLNAQ